MRSTATISERDLEILRALTEPGLIHKVDKAKHIYLIGSLRNPRIRDLGVILRAEGHTVFDDWHGAGPDADDHWQKYEQARGRNYQDALQGYLARHTFHFDYEHLERADIAVLVAPAGKSAHLELGFCIGRGKRGYVLLDCEPERWDVMYCFADGVFYNEPDLLEVLAK